MNKLNIPYQKTAFRGSDGCITYFGEKNGVHIMHKR